MEWRLIDTDLGDPYFVTAADDAIAQIRKLRKVPDTLHFYRRDHPCISVGRSKKISEDINVDACKKHGVTIVRRISGGGTIYTDEGCLIYGLIFDHKKPWAVESIFENVCTSIVNALQRLDIHTNYKKPNDVLLNRKKISGSAVIQKDTITLIHGTILVDTDIELMNKVLKHPQGKASNLFRELEQAPSINVIKKVLVP
jgi:lipoate-protein ligase A